MASFRKIARIGEFTFHRDFSDPAVDVTRRSRTKELETVNEEFIVQVLNRRPDKISIQGVVYGYQIDNVHDLIDAGSVTVRTEDWDGVAVVTNVNTRPRREVDPGTGEWTFDVTLDLVEVSDTVTEEHRDKFVRTLPFDRPDEPQILQPNLANQGPVD